MPSCYPHLTSELEVVFVTMEAVENLNLTYSFVWAEFSKVLNFFYLIVSVLEIKVEKGGDK